MNGVHDMGGMHGFGPINPPAEEPVFSEEWERRMFATYMAVICGGNYNIDEHRHAIERIEGVEYLTGTYYEHWLHANETLLIEKGVISQAELNSKYDELRRQKS